MKDCNARMYNPAGFTALLLLLHLHAAAGTFTVAEVKPHYGCNSADGQDRVRQHIANLTSEHTGLIAVLEMEFGLPQPQGYAAVGAACGKHRDPAVILYDQAQFELESALGASVTGNYSIIPYLGGGQAPRNDTNWMCISDPHGVYGPDGSLSVGSRPYAGAVLRHRASGNELCVLTGTLAHCLYNWTDQFVQDVERGCGDRQLLVVADTNAGCEVPGVQSDSRWSMAQILANHSRSHWGPCHDPGVHAAPTCCNDFPDFPYPRYWYDRTVICRGGRVEGFETASSFVCGDSRAEHLFTKATIHLADPNPVDSPNCLDHPTCAKMGMVRNQSFYGSQMLPVDGLCCPTSTGGMRLPCCDSIS